MNFLANSFNGKQPITFLDIDDKNNKYFQSQEISSNKIQNISNFVQTFLSTTSSNETTKSNDEETAFSSNWFIRQMSISQDSLFSTSYDSHTHTTFFKPLNSCTFEEIIQARQNQTVVAVLDGKDKKEIKTSNIEIQNNLKQSNNFVVLDKKNNIKKNLFNTSNGIIEIKFLSKSEIFYISTLIDSLALQILLKKEKPKLEEEVPKEVYLKDNFISLKELLKKISLWNRLIDSEAKRKATSLFHKNFTQKEMALMEEKGIEEHKEEEKKINGMKLSIKINQTELKKFEVSQEITKKDKLIHKIRNHIFK